MKEKRTIKGTGRDTLLEAALGVIGKPPLFAMGRIHEFVTKKEKALVFAGGKVYEITPVSGDISIEGLNIKYSFEYEVSPVD